MSRFILYGVPLGFSCSDCSHEDYEFLRLDYIRGRHNNQLQIQRRQNGDTYYNYLMYPPEGHNFTDSAGRAGAFFGMSVILTNQVITDVNKLTLLFQKVYQDYVKDKIIAELPNGNKKFLVSNLHSDNDALAMYVARGMANIMKNNPELNIFNNVTAYSPAQVQQYILNKRFLVK